MEAFTALIGAGLLIAGRRFGINMGKDFVINVADSLGLLSADHYVAKAMECDDLDSSIEYTMKALRRNAIHEGALNWRELLEANVDGKIKTLLSLKNAHENAAAKNKAERAKITRRISELTEKAQRLEASRVKLAAKTALLFFLPSVLFICAYLFSFAPSREDALLPCTLLAAASFLFPAFFSFAANAIKTATLNHAISSHETRARVLHKENETLSAELTAITEGIMHFAKRKEFLSACERYLHGSQTIS